MKLIIKSAEGHLIASIDDFQGTIPQKGEYIYHPPLHGGPPVNVMSVKSVTHGILAREGDLNHFVGSAEPFVEVHV